METTDAPGALPGLQTILTLNGITDWDVLLVGDGSGNQWDHGCGWACVLVERETMGHHTFYGAASAGTNYTSELDAYFRPMLWYSNGPGKALLARRMQKLSSGPPILPVHIITDCQILADQGNGLKKRDKNAELWLAFEHIRRRGYSYHWHWMGREQLALNRWADRQSRLLRTTLHEVSAVLERVKHEPADLYNERFGLPNTGG